MSDMRSVPDPGSTGGTGNGRDPWAGFTAGRPSRGHPVGGNGVGDDDPGAVHLVRRLQARVDAQDALLERVAELARRPDDRARLAELRDTSRRMRRDSEALLLLHGADPGARRGAPRAAPSVLTDAVALTDEPARVALRAVPDVELAAAAAVELRHVVAELVDEAADTAPGARIEVGGRTEPDGALAVEIVIAGRGWSDAPGSARRSALGAPRLAERLTRRSASGLRLDRPLVERSEGLVATLLCPAALVTAPPADPWELTSLRSPSGPFPSAMPSSRQPVPSQSLSSSMSSPSLPMRGGSARRGADPVLVGSALSARSGNDELFGPLPTAIGAIGTPIFEAVASAWFRDDEPASTTDWSSPGDREWRTAAAAVARTDVSSVTSSGLPRRSPGDRLVPPPRAARQPATASDERVPERVRDRLSTYQRGLQQGRHRASDSGAPDPDAAPGGWSAEGW